MTIAIPFHLKCRPTSEAVAGFWLPHADRGEVARLCARVGGAWPAVHALDEGFLILFERSKVSRLPGGIPVRRLAGQLYLPADADLVPALHAVEAEEMTAHRGLLFPPHGTPLGFEIAAALRPADLLEVPTARRSGWQPLPEAPVNAAELTRLMYDGPEEPMAILEQGKPEEPSPIEDSLEDMRPPGAQLLTRLMENLRYRTGKILAQMGKMLHAPGFVRKGAEMIGRAIDKVPRLSEDILGRQEAALRELLRRFREGDKEAALRQAPIAVADPDGPGGAVSTGWSLGMNDVSFSLQSLLAGGGRASVWLGGGEIWGQLAAEYRKMAAEAIARGDHRRAAYIYGHLLRDLRGAANALAAGGLHRDAALLYRDRLSDLPAAARAFETAGDFDEALELYEKTENHLAAGDLYKRLRDDARALFCFELAADKLGKSHHNRAAGDLLRERAGRDDLAEVFYRRGWERRDAETVACGHRLFDHYAVASDWRELRQLLTEAEEHLAPPRSASDASQFFSRVYSLGSLGWPEDLGPECRDRARLALAKHLPTAGARPQELFAGEWSPALVRDAAYAQSRLKKTEAITDKAIQKLMQGTVTAAVVSRGSFDIVVGTDQGEIVCWRSATGVVETISPYHHPIDGLAVDGDARLIVSLHHRNRICYIRSHTWKKADRFQYVTEVTFENAELLPAIQLSGDSGSSNRAYVDTDTALYALLGSQLVSEMVSKLDQQNPYENGYKLILDEEKTGTWYWYRNEVILHSHSGWQLTPLTWMPQISRMSGLRQIPFSWASSYSRQLELAGLTLDGELYWSEIEFPENDEPKVRTLSFGEDFQSVDFLRAGKLAAVTSTNRLYWLRAESKALVPFASTVTLHHPVPAVALFALPHKGEVAVLFQDGCLLRVRTPG